MKSKTRDRLTMVAVLAICLIIIGCVSSCASWGNGKIDLPVDVNVSLVTEDGRTFAIHQTDQGIDIQGEFVEPRTGIVFVLGEGVGNITARDPRTGLQVQLAPKETGVRPEALGLGLNGQSTKHEEPSTNDPSPNAHDQVSPSTTKHEEAP